MQIYKETADVARRRRVVTATVRADVKAGWLRVSAMTARGSRLFTEADINAYMRAREAGRKPNAGGSRA